MSAGMRYRLQLCLALTFKSSRFLSHVRFHNTKSDFAKYFSILGVPPDCDQETARQAFLNLVKKYHPDSGNPEASEDRFNEIETAYRKVQEKFAKDRWNVNDCLGEYGLYYEEKVQDDVQEHDIKHTAPQHRQYLSYGGIGSGTPFQREKQYASYRAATAVASVVDYRLDKLQETGTNALIKKEDKKRAKKIKTGWGIERVVEDLIQESMSRGEFDNLEGTGKPLKSHNEFNPYVDFITHKMNQVLIDNGFTPAWITRQKEIREIKEKLFAALMKERSKLGPLPLTEKETEVWNKFKAGFKQEVDSLNNKINTYNLLVPILEKQLLLYDIEKESEKILKDGVPSETRYCEKIENANTSSGKKNETFVQLLTSLFH